MAAATSVPPWRSSSVRYCPAKLASAESSPTAEERTATVPSRAQAAAISSAAGSDPSGVTTNPSGTGSPRRRIRARAKAFPPTRARSSSVIASSQTMAIRSPRARHELPGHEHGDEGEGQSRNLGVAQLEPVPGPGRAVEHGQHGDEDAQGGAEAQRSRVGEERGVPDHAPEQDQEVEHV